MQSVPVRCPHCGKPNLVPFAARGTALRCPFCGAAYLAPHYSAAAGRTDLPEAPAVAPLPLHLANTALAPATQGQPAVTTPPSNDEARGPSTPRGLKLVALLYAIVACMLLGVLAITAGALVMVLSRRIPMSGDVIASGSPHRADNADPLTWTSAAKHVVRDDIRVKIIGVDFGPIRGRNAANESIESGAGEFVKVYLRIENRGQRRVRYTSWYGPQFVDAGQKVTAKLIDSDDRSWPLQRFPGVARIQGHTPQIELTKGERADDVLIFSAPESLLTSGEPLRLSLPAGALARQLGTQWSVQSGFYRFEIPATMLSGELISQD